MAQNVDFKVINSHIDANINSSSTNTSASFSTLSTSIDAKPSSALTVINGGGTGIDEEQLNKLLQTKQDTLVSGTNIKTINNYSILGAGNLKVVSPEELELLDQTYRAETLNINDRINTLNNSLSLVATSGEYEDLLNKPKIPAKTSDLDNDLNFIDKNIADLTNYSKTSDFKAVAFTGNYNDLSYLPNIPTKISQLINDTNYATLTALNKVTELIPNTATTDNQLADKNFVNSSISTATAEFRGTVENLESLNSVTANINDYAFYKHVDANGNTLFDRYKFTDKWEYEYTLNNSSFTTEQWATINSGLTANSIPTNYVTTDTEQRVTAKKVFAVRPTCEVEKTTGHYLPDEYQEVEYIQSSGSQYIDTGINPQVKPRVVMKMAMTNSGDSDYFGNSSINGSAFFGNFSSYGLNFYRYGSTNALNTGISVKQNEWHEWDMSQSVYLDGDLRYTTANTYTYNSSQKNICIFKGRNFATYQLAYFILYDGDEKVREFYPCYRKSDSVIGLYDKVTNEFYPNNGSGVFIKGADVQSGTFMEEYEFLTSEDLKTFSYNDLLDKPLIPNKTSQLTNDSNYLTKTNGDNYYQAKGNYALKSEIPTNYVDLTSNQTIDGTKIFTVVPKVYKNAYVNTDVVLPDEYQLVEYLQSSGVEYIDTNSRIIANTRFTCTWGSVFNNGTFISAVGENKGYGQGNPSGANPNIAGGGRLQNGVITFWISGSNYSTSLNAADSTSVYTDIITTSENTLKFSMTDIINNTIFINNTITNFTIYPVNNMFLFRDSSGQYPFYAAKKIYDVKFETRASSSEDFVVVKHLIPCYRKSDHVCGFYDIIGNEFYTNKGTGAFVSGSDIIDGKLLYNLGFNYNTMLSELRSITGYDSSKTQVLKNVNGTFKWVDE